MSWDDIPVIYPVGACHSVSDRRNDRPRNPIGFAIPGVKPVVRVLAQGRRLS